MPEVLFYQLSQRPLERALPELLEKTVAKGWRAVVRCASEPRLDALNRVLWSFDAESFLPHGTAADGAAERQPIYLTTGEETPNRPDLLFLVDGVTASPDVLSGYTRACIVFDEADPEALSTARASWKAVTAADIPAVFWAQGEGGRWVKKAEKRPE
ncbi:MAG: DNA polymerase III subunit chi [Pseudomonadota bacterium]